MEADSTRSIWVGVAGSLCHGASMAERPVMKEWSELLSEEIVDPTRRIIDPHHHLWPPGRGLPYGLDDLHADTSAGHHVVKTVFVECHAAYRDSGPEHLRPVGETEFVAANAAESERRNDQAIIAGIVAHADLQSPHLDEILDTHSAAGGGRFVGIRDAGASALEPDALTIPGRAPADLYRRDRFRAGVRRLGERGLTFDTWHYHHQNQDFCDLAAAVPNTTMVLDHFGTPLGVGMFAGRRAAIFEQWKDDIAAIAENPNVVAKLGGLAMPDNGFDWHVTELETDATPVTSDQFVDVQGPYYRHTIDCFGPERCMFESNFPVDRWSLSYTVFWNACKKIAADFTETEQTSMFWGTAARVYGLQ